MHAPELLTDLVLVYSLALGLLILAARVGAPPLVALMATGVLAGPSVLGLVSTREEVDVLAEVGLVLLLFTVGLEFSVRVLRRLWFTVLVGGALQMLLTVAINAPLVVATGLSWRVAIFLGTFIALSSTAILLRELGARNQLDSPHGRVVLGVLLFQDIAVVALLLFLPVLTGTRTDAAVGWGALGRSVVALVVVTGAAWVALPRLLRAIAPARTREAFSLAVFLTSLGVAWVGAQAGISMALGAFLAGLILADTEFSHQIHAEVRPIRDILASLFFVTIGMLVDPAVLANHLPGVALAVVLIVGVKFVGSLAALLLTRVDLRPALLGAIILVPVGEFSFVLGRAGLSAGLITPELWQVLLGASVITMAAAPGIMAAAPSIGQHVLSWLRRPLGRDEVPGPRREGHVVILGFGVGGRLLARALRDIHADYVVVELNARTIRESQAAGEPIVYGDASNPDALEAAGLTHARAVVAMLSDPDATRRAVQAARQLAPRLPIIARARYRHEADELQRVGATLAVAEELEASLEVLAQLMSWLGVPGNALEVLLENFRRDTTAGRPLRAPAVPLSGVPEAIQHSPVSTHRVGQGDWADGRTLAEADLRARTGATILAIRIGDRYVTSPPADHRFSPGDLLYLLGDQSDVQLARAHLSDGPRRT